MSKIILEGDQLEAMQKLHTWLSKPTHQVGNIFRLRGTAGSGKTTMLNEACSVLNPKTTALVTPTHKALSVASKGFNYADTQNTVTSLLGLVPKKQGDSFVLKRKPKFDTSDLFKYQVVIIDEADMVDQGHWRYLNDMIRLTDCRIILSGDPCQLPPVNEEESTCSMLDLLPGSQAELTKTRRFGDGVLDFANQVRDKIKGKEGSRIPWENSVGVDGMGVRFLKKADFQQTVVAKLKEMRANGNPDHCKLVSYTNDTAIDFDRRAAKILGYTPDVGFVVGDRVTAKTAYIDGNDDILLCTGEDLVVVSAKPYSHHSYEGLDGQELVVRKIQGETVTIRVLDAGSRRNYTNLINNFVTLGRQMGEWYQFYDLSSHFADIRYGIGLTVHQSQGSTFENVFCDIDSIYPTKRNRRPDWSENLADRLLYTAVTRGKSVYIF